MKKLFKFFIVAVVLFIMALNFNSAIDLSQNSSIKLKSLIKTALADATGETGGVGGSIGCYAPIVYDCHTWIIGVISFTPGQGINCNFTGSWGAPYQCTDRTCDEVMTSRRCVLPS